MGFYLRKSLLHVIGGIFKFVILFSNRTHLHNLAFGGKTGGNSESRTGEAGCRKPEVVGKIAKLTKGIIKR